MNINLILNLKHSIVPATGRKLTLSQPKPGHIHLWCSTSYWKAKGEERSCGKPCSQSASAKGNRDLLPFSHPPGSWQRSLKNPQPTPTEKQHLMLSMEARDPVRHSPPSVLAGAALHEPGWEPEAGGGWGILVGWLSISPSVSLEKP